ncbi:MAG: ion transporter [Bacteroidales bacterium]|nr:ion transporter [Bacteroidales bacterium]
MKLQTFKEELNRVFDDNLHTKQWHNIVDYTIIGFIVLSTIEVFLTTFDTVNEKYETALYVIDWITQIFFTIEVTLRIWNADMLDPKYKGFWGRVRYCFSFYGLIDLLSTYPFYLSFFMTIPYMALKVLRVARLFRVFRYLHSFKLLTSAFRSKKSELLVSMQFLVIITLILSFILFFVEHDAQPEAYDNGWYSVIWAFAQYVGDPGGFGEYPPITATGQVIAFIIGILGIAMFAVPAGLIGSGFTEVMEDEAKTVELKENARRINEFFLVKSAKRSGIFWPAKNLSLVDLKLDLGMGEDDILKAVTFSQNLRLKNLAAAILEGPKNDMPVVSQFHINTNYGCHVERGSSVTIVNAIGYGDNGLSYFDWHIAQLGGFNYVANENFSRTIGDENKRHNFYTIEKDAGENADFQQFIDDTVSNRDENDWIVVVAGEQVVKNITDFHFEFGGEKGETSFDFPECITHDKQKLKQLYDDFCKTMEALQLKTDAHQVQPVMNKANVTRYIQARTKANVLLITVSYKLMVFDKIVYDAIINFADVLNRNLETRKPVGLHKEEYMERPIENVYWKKLYGLVEE